MLNQVQILDDSCFQHVVSQRNSIESGGWKNENNECKWKISTH
jgi:hypothetical protein